MVRAILNVTRRRSFAVFSYVRFSLFATACGCRAWGGIEGWCIYRTLGWMGRTAQLRHTRWNAQDFSVQQSGKGLVRFAGGPAVAMKRNRTFQEGHTHTHHWMLCLWPLCPAIFWTCWPHCNNKVWRMLSWFQSSEHQIVWPEMDRSRDLRHVSTSKMLTYSYANLIAFHLVNWWWPQKVSAPNSDSIQEGKSFILFEIFLGEAFYTQIMQM